LAGPLSLNSFNPGDITPPVPAQFNISDLAAGGAKTEGRQLGFVTLPQLGQIGIALLMIRMRHIKRA